jgi:hypothetical protein
MMVLKQLQEVNGDDGKFGVRFGRWRMLSGEVAEKDIAGEELAVDIVVFPLAGCTCVASKKEKSVRGGKINSFAKYPCVW